MGDVEPHCAAQRSQLLRPDTICVLDDARRTSVPASRAYTSRIISGRIDLQPCPREHERQARLRFGWMRDGLAYLGEKIWLVLPSCFSFGSPRTTSISGNPMSWSYCVFPFRVPFVSRTFLLPVKKLFSMERRTVEFITSFVV